MSFSAVHNTVATPPSEPGNVQSEFASLISGCGLFDLSHRGKVTLAGNDRVRWLNGMVTNNIRDLAAGWGAYAFLLNPQGHILGDMYAYNRGESLILDIDNSQLEKILAVFDHYIIMDDVVVANVSDQLHSLAIAGPEAESTLQRGGFQSLPQEALQWRDADWKDVRVTVVRGDHPGVPWYELWFEPRHASVLTDVLTQAGARPQPHATLELLRVAEGVPRYGPDIRERDLPQETSQERSLNFNKGCYIGQEIVERIRSRGAVHRKFTGFEVAEPMPAPGSKVQVDGKDVGEITSTACLPLAAGERRVAIGYMRREFAAGRQAEAAGTQLTVANLPFAGIFSRQD